jgi:hypothetical protein
LKVDTRANSDSCSEIPYATGQKIILVEPGISTMKMTAGRLLVRFGHAVQRVTADTAALLGE